MCASGIVHDLLWYIYGRCRRSTAMTGEPIELWIVFTVKHINPLNVAEEGCASDNCRRAGTRGPGKRRMVDNYVWMTCRQSYSSQKHGPRSSNRNAPKGWEKGSTERNLVRRQGNKTPSCCLCRGGREISRWIAARIYLLRLTKRPNGSGSLYAMARGLAYLGAGVGQDG